MITYNGQKMIRYTCRFLHTTLNYDAALTNEYLGEKIFCLCGSGRYMVEPGKLRFQHNPLDVRNY